MSTTTIANSEITLSLTPGGLGRLTAALGGSPDENPYPAGTRQHDAWQDSFEDVLALQRIELLGRQAGLHGGQHLNS
jgi:hypothetical protein